MPANYLSNVQSKLQGLVQCVGLFYPQGTGAIVQDDAKQDVTIARTGVGIFTVTFKDRWPFLYGVFAQVELATPAVVLPIFTNIKNPTLGAGGVVTLTLINAAGAAVDVAANGANSIALFANVQNLNKRVK